MPYTGSGVAACIRCWDKVLAKHLLRDAGDPDARLLRLQRDRVQRAGRGAGAAGDRGAARLPARGQAGGAGLGAGDQVRARRRRTCRRRSSSAFSYDRKVLLERYVPGRDLAVSIVEEDGEPRRCRSSRRCREGRDFYDFEARYEIGRTRFVCPAELPDGVDGAHAGAGGRRRTGCSAARGFARVDLMLRRGRRAVRAGGERVPGLTETSLLPQAADAAGIGVRRADRADPRAGAGARAGLEPALAAYGRRRRRSPRA